MVLKNKIYIFAPDEKKIDKSINIIIYKGMASIVKWCEVLHRGTKTRVGLYTEPNEHGKFRWVIPLDRANPIKSDFVFDSGRDALVNAIDSCDWNGFDTIN